MHTFSVSVQYLIHYKFPQATFYDKDIIKKVQTFK